MGADKHKNNSKETLKTETPRPAQMSKAEIIFKKQAAEWLIFYQDQDPISLYKIFYSLIELCNTLCQLICHETIKYYNNAPEQTLNNDSASGNQIKAVKFNSNYSRRKIRGNPQYQEKKRPSVGKSSPCKLSFAVSGHHVRELPNSRSKFLGSKNSTSKPYMQ